MSHFSFTDTSIIMNKGLWSEEEIFLAQCLNMQIKMDSMSVVADLKTTAPVALKHFLGSCFTFLDDKDNTAQKETIHNDIRDRYVTLRNIFNNELLSKLPYREKLKKHQREGLWLSAYKPYNYFAFDMRLGKTITAASLSLMHDINCTLVIAPQNAKWGWYRSLVEDFGYDPNHFTILDASAKRTVRSFLYEKFVIINYDVLEKYIPYLKERPFGHIALDESHRIKNFDSGRFKKVKKIVDMNEGARVSYLSGTPIGNRCNDVFAYHKLVDLPLGHDYKKFMNDFTHSVFIRNNLKVKSGKNLDKLNIMMSNFMIRKTRKECTDIPDTIFTKVYFRLDDYKEEYYKILKEAATNGTGGAAANSINHRLNILVSKSKIPGIIDLAENIIENNGKVVIFTNYTEPLLLLEDYFKERCFVIRGGVSTDKRRLYEQQFRDDPEKQVWIANMEAGSEGSDLSVACDVIVCDFPMTPRPLRQATARTDNMNKVVPTNAHIAIAEESIDEMLEALILDKAKDINVAIDGGKDVGDSIGNMPQLLLQQLIDKMNAEEKVE